jgi:hypothetical protein
MNARSEFSSESQNLKSSGRRASLARPFAWPVIAAILVAYVVAEIVFNLELVATVAQPAVDRERLDELVNFGKATGAFGIVLFAMRPFFARAWKRIGWGLPIGFLALWGVCFAVIDRAYDEVLSQVPASIQREALYLTVYRDALFQGGATDVELGDAGGVRDDAQRLALLNLAARLTGEKPEIASVKTRIDEAELAQQIGIALDARTQALVAHSKSDDPAVLREATAAILLPPMSMTLSLVAIVANLAALLGLLLTVFLRRRRAIRFLAPLLPFLAVAIALMAAHTPPFPVGSHNRALFSQLDDQLGVLGWIWSRAVNGQAMILRLTENEGGNRII